MKRGTLAQLSSLAVLTFALSGCATTTQMSASDTIPAAEGTVTAKSDDNANTDVEVKVEHLAAPAMVSKRATTYVVWARPLGHDQGTTGLQNLGTLQVDDDRSGELSTTTALHSFEVFVTAEPSGTVPSPTGEPLLWAEVNQSR